MSMPMILPINPVVPQGNTVTFTTLASGTAAWGVTGGGATVQQAQQSTCVVQATGAPGTTVQITDGLGNTNTLYIVQAGIPGGMTTNTVAYDAARSTLYFQGWTAEGPLTQIFTNVAAAKAPGGVEQMMDARLATYLASPLPQNLSNQPEEQYCTCILVNLNAITGD